MKRNAAYWLARLYPAAWRERYGEEFDALVEDSRPGWRGLADIAFNALAMQWRAGLSPLAAAVWCGLAGLVIATPVALLIPDSFISMAVLETSSAGAVKVPSVVDRVLRRSVLTELMERRQLYTEDRLTQEERLMRFRRNITVTGLTPIRNSSRHAFRVGFAYHDAGKARDVARDLMVLFLDDAKQNAGAPRIELLDHAPLPQGPWYPNRPVMVFTGLLMGALPAALIAMIRRGRVLGAAVMGAMAGAALMICFITWHQWWSGPATVAVVSMDGGAAALEDSIATVLSGPKLEAIAARHGLRVLELKANLHVTAAMPEDHDQRLVRFAFKHKNGWQAEAVVADVVAGVADEYKRRGGQAVLATVQSPSFVSRPPQPARPSLPVGALIGAIAAFALAVWRRRPASPKPVYGT